MCTVSSIICYIEILILLLQVLLILKKNLLLYIIYYPLYLFIIMILFCCCKTSVHTVLLYTPGTGNCIFFNTVPVLHARVQ